MFDAVLARGNTENHMIIASFYSIFYLRGAFINYCNCHRNSHAMHEIPMKYNTGNSSIFYLSMDTRFVQIGALVFVLHPFEMSSFK